jgi:glycosyltransferase involved in cell wall biosynthesis
MDVMHQFFASQFAQEARESGIPCVQIVHNGDRHQFVKLAIFNSDYTRKRSNAEPGDVTLLPPAYPDCIAETHGDKIGFIKPLPHKGVDLVYRLAELLPDRRFLILQGEWYTLEIIRNDLPNVTFLQPVDDIREFYSQCRIILMPSLSEDAGTVPQEAAMNGLPCISSNVGGLPETNPGGILLQPDDASEWVRQIELLDDGEYYAAIAAHQKARLGGFHWQEKIDRISEIISAEGR